MPGVSKGPRAACFPFLRKEVLWLPCKGSREVLGFHLAVRDTGQHCERHLAPLPLSTAAHRHRARSSKSGGQGEGRSLRCSFMPLTLGSRFSEVCVPPPGSLSKRHSELESLGSLQLAPSHVPNHCAPDSCQLLLYSPYLNKAMSGSWEEEKEGSSPFRNLGNTCYPHGLREH